MASLGVRIITIALLGLSLVCCDLAGQVRPVEGFLVMVSSYIDCQESPCTEAIIIESNGLIRRPGSDPALGRLPPEVLEALTTAIAATDFDALRNEPWQGLCKGDEFAPGLVIYDFFVAAGSQRVAACGTEFDRGHPLFMALGDALRVVGLPLPLPGRP